MWSICADGFAKWLHHHQFEARVTIDLSHPLFNKTKLSNSAFIKILQNFYSLSDKPLALQLPVYNDCIPSLSINLCLNNFDSGTSIIKVRFNYHMKI